MAGLSTMPVSGPLGEFAEGFRTELVILGAPRSDRSRKAGPASDLGR